MRPEGCGEGAVFPPVASEYVPVNFAEIHVEPALDGAAVYVRRKTERCRAGRPAADAIGISRSLIGIDVMDTFVLRLPQFVQENTDIGKRLRLPRFDLGA